MLESADTSLAKMSKHLGSTEQTDGLVQLVRNNWSPEEVTELFVLPFNDLLFKAQNTHRAWFDPNEVQMSTLLSIKTGGCPEDCGYCSQSVKFDTSVIDSSFPAMPSKTYPPYFFITTRYKIFRF